MNGVICWVIPILYAFVCMMCNALEGDRNGDTISECTRERGDMYTQVTETLFSIGGIIIQLGLYTLPLLQCGVREYYNGEGEDVLLWLASCIPQPFHEWCHLLGDPHCICIFVHYFSCVGSL